MPKLTHKQNLFVQYYDGNATQAALKAGYSKNTAHRIGAENMQKPAILSAIKDRQNKDVRHTGHIATREERQAFWTKVLNDENEAMNNRLKAAELLGKSEADFTQKTEISGNMTMGLKDALDDAERKTGVIPQEKVVPLNKHAA